MLSTFGVAGFAIVSSLSYAQPLQLASSRSDMQRVASTDGTRDANQFGVVTAGLAAAPSYLGSASYDPIPFVAAYLPFGRRYLELKGLNLRANLLDANRMALGPILNLRLPRDSGAGEARIAQLDSIDTALELGVFARAIIARRADGSPLATLDADVLADVSGVHRGVTGTVGASWAALRVNRIFVDMRAETTFANRNFQQTYFSIKPDEADRSGLQVCNAGAGSLSAGLSLTAGYAFSPRWGLVATASYSRLLGDAAESPVVQTAGSRDQFFGGVGVSYRFGKH